MVDNIYHKQRPHRLAKFLKYNLGLPLFIHSFNKYSLSNFDVSSPKLEAGDKVVKK